MPPSWYSWGIFLSCVLGLAALPTVRRKTVPFSTLFWDEKSLPTFLQNTVNHGTVFLMQQVFMTGHASVVWDFYTWLWNNFAVHFPCTHVPHSRSPLFKCPPRRYQTIFLWSWKHACACLVGPPSKHGPENFTPAQQPFLRGEDVSYLCFFSLPEVKWLLTNPKDVPLNMNDTPTAPLLPGQREAKNDKKSIHLQAESSKDNKAPSTCEVKWRMEKRNWLNQHRKN